MSIIEENLCEYVRIKQQLTEVLEGIKMSNKKEDDEDAYSVDIDDEDYVDGHSPDGEELEDEGDILTQMLKGKI